MNAQLSHAETQARSTARRKVMLILSACMALQMTSFVMILPLFARRFSELGAGVESLGISAMAYALSATLAAPLMGALADRFGRRRIVLISLAIYIVAFTGYRFASSALAFIILRAFAGAFTAGLIPAVTSIVADLAPIDRKAQCIGIVNGGASIGWITGPVLGGVLYDRWGYNIALIAAIVMAGLTFAVALLMVPETRKSLAHLQRIAGKVSTFRQGTFRETFPLSFPTFTVLLAIAFGVMFAWAFIEPKFMFYAYDDLDWSSSMLGLVMSTYGIAMTLGEFFLAQLSDRLGRKPVIVCGVLLFAAQFIGLAFFQNYILIAASFVIAGFGNALFDPALSASILDIAPVEHQARILGIKSTAASLGSILGPALVVLFTPFWEAGGIFLAATGIVCISILFFVFIPIKPRPIHFQAQQIADKNFVSRKTAR